MTAHQAGAALVDLEVYPLGDANGVFQQVWGDQAFAAGETKTYPVRLPGTLAPGEYVVKIGDFRPDWGVLWSWNNDAARVRV